MKRISWFGLALLAGVAPAAAQLEPLTTQELQQQNQSTIQNSAQSLERGMTQQQIGEIEQQQRRQQLFARDPNRTVYAPDPYVVPLQPGDYVIPPLLVPPPPAPPPPKP